MAKNSCLKVSFSKLDLEEVITIYLHNEKCSVFDVPKNAEIVSICFSPNHEICPECLVFDSKVFNERCSGDDDYIDIDDPLSGLLEFDPVYPEYYNEKARLQSFDAKKL